MNENPYAPPLSSNPLSPDASESGLLADAKRRLNRTAIAIISLAGISLVLDFILLAEDVFAPTHSRFPQFGVPEHSILAVVHAIQLIGGLRLRRVTSIALAYAGAIACCIPCFSPLGVVGIPFGVYAINLLQQHDIKVAFRTPPRVAGTEEKKPTDASEAPS